MNYISDLYRNAALPFEVSQGWAAEWTNRFAFFSDPSPQRGRRDDDEHAAEPRGPSLTLPCLCVSVCRSCRAVVKLERPCRPVECNAVQPLSPRLAFSLSAHVLRRERQVGSRREHERVARCRLRCCARTSRGTSAKAACSFLAPSARPPAPARSPFRLLRPLDRPRQRRRHCRSRGRGTVEPAARPSAARCVGQHLELCGLHSPFISRDRNEAPSSSLASRSRKRLVGREEGERVRKSAVLRRRRSVRRCAGSSSARGSAEGSCEVAGRRAAAVLIKRR